MKINPVLLKAPASPSIPPRSPIRRFAETLDSDETSMANGFSFAEETGPTLDGTSTLHPRQLSEQARERSFSGDESQQNDKEERKSRTRGERDATDQAGHLNNHNSAIRETSLTKALSPPPVRAILHISDLERIIAVCRLNTFEGGQQITLQLPNSIFAGLRVKISCDSLGAITTEFIASKESIRAQLEARAAELSGVMRNRGLKLAEVKTTLDTAFSDQQDKSGTAHPFQELKGQTVDKLESTETPSLTVLEQITETDRTYLA